MIDKQFKVTNISKNGNTGLFWLGKDNISVYDVVQLLNELNEENEQLKIRFKEERCIAMRLGNQCDTLMIQNHELKKENKQLKQQIKDLRIDILDSIHKANEIQCSCNPCVVEECVKKVVE